MSLCQFHFYSQTLLKQTSAAVILPDVLTPPFATFYLLHGLSDDHSIWLRRTRIEHYVRNLPLIVVMPDGNRHFYTNNELGPAYAKFFGEELPGVIERTFHARSERQGRAVGGLSMGGYGALRVAFEYPNRFISANSHSGALSYGRSIAPDYESPLTEAEFKTVFGGRAPKGSDHDLVALAERSKKAGLALPKLLLDCGTEDPLLPQSREVHEDLTRLGVVHEYHEYPGQHDWDYWDEHIRQALEFHARAMNLPVSPL